jgi:23S rRNA U2552 (ribose-2'-O)-methylase RlmE/FtsJ
MMLSGKHTGKDVYHGTIIRLFGTIAEIHADVAPEKLSDLRIELFDQEGNQVASDLYAKVSEHNTSDSSVFNVHFTFIPPSADIFIRSTLDGLF